MYGDSNAGDGTVKLPGEYADGSDGDPGRRTDDGDPPAIGVDVAPPIGIQPYRFAPTASPILIDQVSDGAPAKGDKNGVVFGAPAAGGPIPIAGQQPTGLDETKEPAPVPLASPKAPTAADASLAKLAGILTTPAGRAIALGLLALSAWWILAGKRGK